MTLRWQMLELLADGQLCSGEVLARRMGVSRAAIWKHKQSLDELGLEVEAVRGRGYRLSRPIELLDATRIEQGLSADARGRLARLQVFREIDSTNTYLQRQLAPAPGSSDVCLAEFQSAGRGRRGRSWRAPFGAGIYMSLAWTFAEQPAELSALSLVIGVGVMQALGRLGIEDVQLKWPNDLLVGGAKLGGILIELRVEVAAATEVIVGIGLNVRLPRSLRDELAAQGHAALTDLAEVTADAPPPRNRIAACLIDAVTEVLAEFGRTGFAPFRPVWLAHDAYIDRQVQLTFGERIICGIERGVDRDGALLVEVDGEAQRFVSGDVSLKR